MDARQFIAELKTRGVYRVAALYCAGAWALLQVADVFFPILELPEDSVTVLLVLVAIGFPVALLLTWLFDLTPEGVVSTEAAGRGPTPTPRFATRQLLEMLVIAVLVVLVGYLYVERLTPTRQAQHDTGHVSHDSTRPSIAVLPFVDLSGNSDMHYLGDGLAEEILSLLARLTELNVAARTSSFIFREQEAGVAEIAAKLGVGHVLEGSVRRDGERVRVAAQLIDANNGFNVWAQSYDRNMGDLLDLQEEIARHVVEALQVVLSEQSNRQLSRSHEIEPIAYDYYLRGREYLRKQADESNLEAGASFFRRALEVGGSFADAWAGLCDALLGQYAISQRGALFTSSETACQRALALDPGAVAVYVALGNLYRVSGQYELALEAFESALDLNPSAVDALRGRGRTFASMNQPLRAERDLQAAIHLQPKFWGAQNDLATFYFDSGQFGRAIPYFQRVADLNPNSETALNNLGAAFYMLGKPERAVDAWRRSVVLAPTAISLSNLGSSLFFAGRFEEAAQKYEQAIQLAPENYEYWGNLGEALLFTPGEEAASVAALERAIELAKIRQRINPNDHLARAMLASYLARIGSHSAAAEYLEDATPPGERNPFELYSRAVAYTVLNEGSAALEALEQAVELGYPVSLLALDRNFAELRQTHRFKALVMPADQPSDATTFEELAHEKQ